MVTCNLQLISLLLLARNIIVRSAAKDGAISELRMIHARTGTLIGVLRNGTIVYLNNSKADLTILVIPDQSTGPIGKVEMGWNRLTRFRVDRREPYTLCGGLIRRCYRLRRAGTHTVTATVVGSQRSYSVQFQIAEGEAPVPVPVLPPSSQAPMLWPTPHSSPIPVPVPVPSSQAPMLWPTPHSSPILVPTEAPPLDGSWLEVDANPSTSFHFATCFVMVDNPTVGRRAYLVGGRGNSDTDIYFPTNRTWSKGAQLPLQMHHMQCVGAQGKLWIMAAWIGSYPNEKNPNNSFVYDPALDQWALKSALPLSRRRGSAAVIVSSDENKIYVSHGNSGGHETETNNATSLPFLDVYDIATDTWTALSSSAPNPRDHTGGAMVNGNLCVAGGRNGGILSWPTVASTDCYNLATGLWQVKAPIPNPRAGSSYGLTCDGKLIIAGGEGGGQAWNGVDVFDGESWVTIDDLVVARHGAGLAVDCVCNLIHIVGGEKVQGSGSPTKSMETYFPRGTALLCGE